jgi:hypothetical protein
VDANFAADVEDAWRERVGPALLEIEEALREHGLLREVGRVVTGDPKRILLDTVGGALVATHQNLVSLSGLLAAAAAAGVPPLDVACRAARETLEARAEAERNSFYFLHQVGRAAAGSAA